MSLRFALPPWPAEIDRTLDAGRLNPVANHPDVRPWLGGEGPLDLTPLVSNPQNLAYATDAGGFLAVALGDGHYEAHSLFLPDGRRDTVRAVRAALDHFFAASDGLELTTKAPEGNRGAAALAQLAGFTDLCTLALPWPDAHVTRPTRVLTLSIDTWALRSAQALAHGVWLHEAMAAGQAQAGSAHQPHADDPVHHRFTGAATLIVRAGQPAKAVRFYNRWAAVIGFQPMTLLQRFPVILDLGGMVVEHRGHEMEILSCQ